MVLRWIIALLLIGATSASWAAPGDENWCRNGLFPTEPPFSLAQVTGTDRAYFHEDMEGCPDRGMACRQHTYVVPGNHVITNRTHGSFTCAFYPSRGGGTAGWVQSERLHALPVATNPLASAWLGRWSSEGNPEVRITARGKSGWVAGEAYWPGPPGTHNYPSTHDGAIDGALVLTGNRAHHSDGENWCKVEFTLLGDLLIAADNDKCGGMNVSFSAVYRRVGR
jgi:hypothetical protein